jgi:hypothetical protein
MTSTAAQASDASQALRQRIPRLVLGDPNRAAERHIALRRHDLDHAAANLNVYLAVDRGQCNPVWLLNDPGRDLDAFPGPDRPAIRAPERRAAGVMQPAARVTLQQVGPFDEPASMLMRLDPA